MKLTAETKLDLRSFDCEYGGGISATGTKTDVINKPILILGLGGTGAEALIRIKRAISEQFNLGTDALGRKLDKPHQIEYMAIDSDANMQNLSYGGVKFSNSEFLCLDTANLTSIYKNRDSVFKNATEGWISDSLRLQQVKHGAGGIRQAGRLLLTINCNNLISILSEKIGRLTTNRNANDLLYVFIVTGCAGGTGSGIFIDIPYIVRKIAAQKGFEAENIGMIFMPDVTLADSTIDGSAALNIKANGFAALKELDYIMNIERNGETFEQTYADLEIRENQPPYDLCHLVSAKDEHGKLAPQAKDYCMNVAAETIINFITSEEVIDGQSYTISSYLSNIENNRSAFIMSHQQKQPVNYIYNTIGAASAVLPINFLLNYMTHQMFSELDGIQEHGPSYEETQLLLESMDMDMPTLERVLGHNKPPVRDFNQYDLSVLLDKPDILEDAVKRELTKLEEHYNKVADEIISDFTNELASKTNAMYQNFVDISTGPFYVQRQLNHLYESSLTSVINNLRKKDIPAKRENRDNLNAVDMNRKSAANKLRKKSIILLGKKSQAAQLVELNETYLRMASRNLMYDAMDHIYNIAAEKLSNFHNQIVDTHCELLLTLKGLFAKFRDVEGTNQAGFAWDFENVHKFYNAFEKDTDNNIDYRLALTQLLQDMIEYEGWLPGPDNTIVDNLNTFVSWQFENVAGKSIDYYCNMMANAEDISFADYVGDKLEELNTAAKVMFPLNHIPSGLHITFPPYAYMSIPSNAPKLHRAIQNMGGRIPNIKYSKLNNRLYMMKLNIAVALYCYKDITDYETVYENSLSKMAGVHLYESATTNWKNLPSPLYDKLWTKDHENLREHAKNNQLREIFDKAIAAGIIRHDENMRRLVGYFGDPMDIQKNFANIENSIADKTITAAGARAAIASINELLTSEDREKYSVPLFDTEYLPGTSKPDIEYAKGVFIYMPALNRYISKEIELRSYLAVLHDKLSKIDAGEVKYNHFAQLLYMRVITKNRKNYRYALDGELHILYTTQSLSEQYVEYDIFQAYLGMDDAVSAHLTKHAQEEENRYSDKEFVAAIKTIDDLTKVYKEKLKQLEDSFSSERDGSLKKIFYQTMINVFAREKKILS